MGRDGFGFGDSVRYEGRRHQVLVQLPDRDGDIVIVSPDNEYFVVPASECERWVERIEFTVTLSRAEAEALVRLQDLVDGHEMDPACDTGSWATWVVRRQIRDQLEG